MNEQIIVIDRLRADGALLPGFHTGHVTSNAAFCAFLNVITGAVLDIRTAELCRGYLPFFY